MDYALLILNLLALGAAGYLVGFFILGMGRMITRRMTFEERLLAFMILAAVMTAISIAIVAMSGRL